MPLIPEFSLIYKASYFIMAIPTILVIIIAVLSSKEMGGTLGKGLKKIALGTIVDSILIATYIFWERGAQGIIDENIMKYFFLGSGIFASVFLISGFYQIYEITKRLKLSSP
jgi:hypothetical protein